MVSQDIRLDVLCKIHYETQARNGGLVDLAHRIVDEEARDEHG